MKKLFIFILRILSFIPFCLVMSFWLGTIFLGFPREFVKVIEDFMETWIEGLEVPR